MDKNLVILAGGISSRMKKSFAENESDSGTVVNSKSMISVGDNNRPFLDYLLYNARKTEYSDVVIVISERDDSLKKYYGEKDKFNSYKGLQISYAVQKIPEGRNKPLGTADALKCALESREDWKGKKFTSCNSDNLYSQKALRLILESKSLNAMIDYDRNGLKFENDRTNEFAVTRKDNDGYLTDIIEKPSNEEIDTLQKKDGYVGVSMNIFRLSYDMIFPFLQIVPLHPVRNEKELTTAIKIMIDENSKSLLTIPLNEHVPDLTSKNDIENVKEYLRQYYSGIDF